MKIAACLIALAVAGAVLAVPACTPQPVVPTPDADAMTPPPAPVGDSAAPAPPPVPPPSPNVTPACQAACTALVMAKCPQWDAGDCGGYMQQLDSSGQVPNPAAQGHPLTCIVISTVKTQADAQRLGFVCK